MYVGHLQLIHSIAEAFNSTLFLPWTIIFFDENVPEMFILRRCVKQTIH